MLEEIITSWNPVAQRISGFTAGEMAGRTILRLVHLFPTPRAGASGQYNSDIETHRMKNTLFKFLCLEDSAEDLQLIVEALRADGLTHEVMDARTQKEFQAALNQTRFDLIISDFSMPSYNGMAALAAAQKAQPETPFLFVSGTIGEERVVESLKSGATDYVLKTHLKRLGPAVRRALHEARERTGRRKAEDSLKESEARFRQLAENIDEVFWLTDTQKGVMLYVNPAYEKIWGRTRASLYQDPHGWLEAIHPEDRERIREAVVTRQTKGGYDETYRIVRPDGSIRWIRDRACPIHEESGEVYRVVGTAEDITEQRSLEERYRQAQKMEAIGQLAGGVAHDFNNLLTVMLGNTELVLMRADRLDAETCENLKQVVDAARRAANLTRQLLAFSRKQVLQPQTLNLNELVANLVKLLDRVISEDIQLQCNYSAQAAFVHADPGMMEQVLMNLVVNARDAMPAGGKLVIGTEMVSFNEDTARMHPEARRGEFACLTVSDTGSGIAPEHIARLFEPFFTTKESGKGTGLGLATVYGIVKQHLGWVEVASRPGAGSTFKVFLPATQKPMVVRAESGPEAAPRGGTETILLVEDDLPVQLLTRRALEAFGYRVLEASSGPEALEIWRQRAGEIDLLLTDNVMPGGIVGRSLAEMLRKDRPGLKVIYISGYSPDQPGKQAKPRSKHGTEFLQKPYRSTLLMESVRRCLDHH
jgi:two-component system cell cycle sensor histidine kinase/response regulator CckA